MRRTSRRITERWIRLFEIANRRGIVNVLGAKVIGAEPESWGGRWRYDPTYGPAIILNYSLGELEAQWIYAHELGHDVTWREYSLFETPAAQDASAGRRDARAATKSKWQKPRVRARKEDEASSWAANFLISQKEWRDAETRCPGCLLAMAELLEVHSEAALWRSRSEPKSANFASVNLSQASINALDKEVNGTGGHQALLHKLRSSRSGSRLTISRADYNTMREYLRTAEGGYGRRFRCVMSDVLSAMHERGGIYPFFGTGRRPRRRTEAVATEQLTL